MNTGLKNALIIIFVLVCLYYFISPYQNCLREESGRNYCEDWSKYIYLYKTKEDCVSWHRYRIPDRCNSASSW
jgi:hypothetical protein